MPTISSDDDDDEAAADMLPIIIGCVAGGLVLIAISIGVMMYRRKSAGNYRVTPEEDGGAGADAFRNVPTNAIAPE